MNWCHCTYYFGCSHNGNNIVRLGGIRPYSLEPPSTKDVICRDIIRLCGDDDLLHSWSACLMNTKNEQVSVFIWNDEEIKNRIMSSEEWKNTETKVSFIKTRKVNINNVLNNNNNNNNGNNLTLNGVNINEDDMKEMRQAQINEISNEELQRMNNMPPTKPLYCNNSDNIDDNTYWIGTWERNFPVLSRRRRPIIQCEVDQDLIVKNVTERTLTSEKKLVLVPKLGQTRHHCATVIGVNKQIAAVNSNLININRQNRSNEKKISVMNKCIRKQSNNEKLMANMIIKCGINQNILSENINNITNTINNTSKNIKVIKENQDKMVDKINNNNTNQINIIKNLTTETNNALQFVNDKSNNLFIKYNEQNKKIKELQNEINTLRNNNNNNNNNHNHNDNNSVHSFNDSLVSNPNNYHRRLVRNNRKASHKKNMRSNKKKKKKAKLSKILNTKYGHVFVKEVDVLRLLKHKSEKDIISIEAPTQTVYKLCTLFNQIGLMTDPRNYVAEWSSDKKVHNGDFNTFSIQLHCDIIHIKSVYVHLEDNLSMI